MKRYYTVYIREANTRLTGPTVATGAALDAENSPQAVIC